MRFSQPESGELEIDLATTTHSRSFYLAMVSGIKQEVQVSNWVLKENKEKKVARKLGKQLNDQLENMRNILKVDKATISCNIYKNVILRMTCNMERRNLVYEIIFICALQKSGTIEPIYEFKGKF